MKKKSYAAGLGALAVALTLVTTSLMGGTLAKYATAVTGSATATVAQWSFKATGKDGAALTTPIELGATGNRTAYAETGIKDDVIAPGTTGSFDIEIDGSGSEVGIDYKFKIASKTGDTFPDNFTFKTQEGTDAAKSYTLGDEMTGTIPYSDTAENMKKTVKVTWEWPIGEATAPGADNVFAGKAPALDITITGTQVTPETTAP